jgi:hypothetical protein
MCFRSAGSTLGPCRRICVSAGKCLKKGDEMNRNLIAGTSANRLSRQSAIGKLAGAGAAVSVAAAGLGTSRDAAQGASSRVQSSVVTTCERRSS